MSNKPDTTILAAAVEKMLAEADGPALETLVRGMIRRFGDDPDRPGLKETPTRFLKAMAEYTKGYSYSEHDVGVMLKCFDDGAEDYDQMVCQRNIPISSLCEHHLAPFFGVAHIAYIPKGRVIGLSKLSRVADVYANRFQVQERLTKQIAEAILVNVNPLGVGVVIECRHLCMECRGVRKIGSSTTTSCLLGVFRDDAKVRQEFLDLTRHA